MSTERSRSLDSLYHAALERPVDTRVAFLTEACAGDDALQREVMSLLDQPASPGFLSTPALEMAAAMMIDGGHSQWVGQRIGVYQVQALLGKGGMGEVYRAHDTRLGREVAIKVLPRMFTADPERLARFEREARLLAAVNHANVGALYGLEEGDGVHALVLELVDGETLAERVARGPVAIPEALAIARQIADALDAAHEKGIVHRDLKPANVKLTLNGVVKVLDFGLAKVGTATTGTDPHSPGLAVAGTQDGVVLGTAPYMSPEQVRGLTVDKRSDVWAFGCVLYELLTGRAIFARAAATDTLAAILTEEPDWKALPPALPASVTELLHRCLEKDVRIRKRDIGDARAELNDAIARRFVSDEKDPARTFGQRVPWVTVALAGVTAAVLGFWPKPAPPNTAPPAAFQNPLADAQFTQLTDFPGIETDAVISPDGRFVAFVSDRDGPFDILVTQVGTGRFRNRTQDAVDDLASTGSVRSLGFTADGAEIWLRGTLGRRLRRMPLFDGAPRPFLGEGVFNAAWAPDGTRLVYQTNDDGDPLFVADRNGSNPTKIFESDHNHGPVWAADGQWIYFLHGRSGEHTTEVWRIRPSGGQHEVMLRLTRGVRRLAPLDARTVLYTAAAEDGAGPWLWALDVETRTSRRVSWGLEQYTSIAASADGRRLVATVARPRANLWRVPIGSRPAGPTDARPYPVPGVRVWGPRIRGTSLFYLSAQGTGGGLWRYRDGQSVEIWRGSQGGLSEPAAVSPDGLQAAIVLRKEGRRILTLVETDGSQSRTLGGAFEILGTPDWSPDGSWVVAGGNDGDGPGLFKIPVAGGAPIRLVSGEATHPSWSPKGDLILYKGRNVSAQSPVLGVRPDGGRVELPVVETTGDLRFLPDGSGAVFVRGGFGVPRAFWLLDLSSRTPRRLTELRDDPKLGEFRHFDISADGHIIFDRLNDNSDIVLIDLPRR